MCIVADKEKNRCEKILGFVTSLPYQAFRLHWPDDCIISMPLKSINTLYFQHKEKFVQIYISNPRVLCGIKLY